MDLAEGAVDAASDEQQVVAAALAATAAAMHSRGLVLLSHAPLVICRAIDTCQTDPLALDVSCCGLQECCMLEVGTCALQPEATQCSPCTHLEDHQHTLPSPAIKLGGCLV